MKRKIRFIFLFIGSFYYDIISNGDVMKKGQIIKSIGELYTIQEVGTKEKVALKPRGNIRYKGQKPKVGDFVMYDKQIEKILDRRNDLVRPPICNIDQAILVFSCIRPEISYSLLDRFLSIIEHNNIEVKLVITKVDLCEDIDKVKETLSYYGQYYDVFFVNNKDKETVEELKAIFADKVSVFTGQTGVGKSSLLNALGSFQLKTDEISEALGRGKHTTRHTELFEYNEGLVADTPGFSSLDFIDMTIEDLRDSFVDFDELSGGCRYRGCFHHHEPTKDCCVKQEVEKGNILKSRYESYIAFLEEIKAIKVKY